MQPSNAAAYPPHVLFGDEEGNKLPTPKQITPNEFSRLFPNASKSCRRANSQDDDTHCDSVPAPEPQRVVRDATLATHQRKEKGSSQFRVHIEGRRSRKIDPDNVIPKYLLDCVRRAGLIPDDDADTIELTISQTKVKAEQECTVITIDEPA